MLGQPVPHLRLPSTGRSTFQLSSMRSSALVPAARKFPFEKKVRGIARSTFVIDRNGVLAREWRGVMVPGHVEEVLNFAKAL